MPLECVISANGVGIGDVYIQRTAPLTTPRPETICTYRFEVRRGGYVRRGFGVHHRYGDGPMALVARVLLAAARATPAEERVPEPRPNMHTRYPKR